MDTISLLPRKSRALKLLTQHHNIHRSPLSTIRVMFVVSTRPIIHTPGTSIPCSQYHTKTQRRFLAWGGESPHPTPSESQGAYLLIQSFTTFPQPSLSSIRPSLSSIRRRLAAATAVVIVPAVIVIVGVVFVVAASVATGPCRSVVLARAHALS